MVEDIGKDTDTTEFLSHDSNLKEWPHHEDAFKLWALAIVPAVGHFLFTCFITIVVMFLIDKKPFNITLRRQPLVQFDGSKTYSTYRPLQADITTALSFSLSVMRIVSGMWTSTMTWRCAFILMEKTGLSLKDIDWIVTYRIPAGVRARRSITIVIAIILLLAIPSQLAAPILTGSITWAPEEIMVQGDHAATGILLASDGNAWRNLGRYPEVLQAIGIRALSIADTAWGGMEAGTTMKRVLPSTAHLPVNSRLDNVTVPYFTVDAIEWIKDPALNAANPANNIGPHDLSVTRPEKPGGLGPYFAAALVTALIPDGTWGLPAVKNFSSPTTISETRTLWALHSQHTDTPSPCNPSPAGFFGGLPSDVRLYPYTYNPRITNCIAYARVKYTAGAAICKSCRLSAPTVVQPDTALKLIPDPMTYVATTFMPLLSTNMGLGGSSVSSPGNITQYILDILPRSYGAAWTALASFLPPDDATTLTTGVKIPDQRRCYTGGCIFGCS